MIVISDATPIISLIKIECLDVLEKLYKNIIIPKAVYDELIINTDYQDEIDIIKRCTFLEIKNVEENLSVLLLQRQLKLDRGESEAIVLANNINAKLIIIDEIKARRIAKDMVQYRKKDMNINDFQQMELGFRLSPQFKNEYSI